MFKFQIVLAYFKILVVKVGVYKKLKRNGSLLPSLKSCRSKHLILISNLLHHFFSFAPKHD